MYTSGTTRQAREATLTIEMPGSGGIKAALERVLAGTASEDDRGAVRSALVNGVLVTGKRAVAIGGSASDVIITTDNGNIAPSSGSVDATRQRKRPGRPGGIGNNRAARVIKCGRR